jgi:hypothetical protein
VYLKTIQERRHPIRKSVVCICALIMAFAFVSCKTTPKATPETSKPGKPLAPSSFNLNGKWKVTVEWENEYRSGTSNLQYEIVQKGMEITMINTRSGDKFPFTLKGDIIHLEPRDAYDLNSGVTSYFPAREYKISQDGNTLTCECDYTWDNGRDRGPASMTVTMIRE